jgi:hypothetical protein
MSMPTEQYYVYYIESTFKVGAWKELEAACVGASGPSRRFTSLGPYGPGGGVHRRGNCVQLGVECVWRGGYVGFAAASPTCECLGDEEAEGAVWQGGFASLRMLDVNEGWEVYTPGMMEDEDEEDGDDGSIMEWQSSVYRKHRRDARPYEEGGCIVRQTGGGADCCAGTAELFLVRSERPQPPRVELCAWCFPGF